MERLTWTRYNNSDSIIMIDLHNGYTVIALKMWNKENGFYEVELRLKENTVEKWDLIEKAERLEFMINYKFINGAILKWVAVRLQEGFFDYYIKRLEYELKCFDKGNEIFEKDQLELAG